MCEEPVLAQRARREAEARLAEQPRRLAHVRGVATTAERLSRRFDAQTADCLVAAGWLHDIGYAPSVRRTGFHPLDGAEFVRSAGFGELVASLVAFHTGAHAEAAERGLSGLSAFSDPPSNVLDALTFCDLTTGPDGAPISPRDRLRDVLARYGSEDPVHRAVDAGRDELLAAVRRVRDWL
ncbi:HD domain-containing protein [Mycobacteroides abscessus]|nr:HD domain-containing protein [Mycobacteroides abscessus]